MTVEEAIRIRIEDLPDVVALTSDRIYLDKAPQGTVYPVVVVQLIDDPERYHLRGPTRLHRARIQIDAYTLESNGNDAYGQASTIADAIAGDGAGPVATGLCGWFGFVGSPDFEITSCFRIDRTRGYEAEDMREVRIRQDFYVNFRSQA